MKTKRILAGILGMSLAFSSAVTVFAYGSGLSGDVNLDGMIDLTDLSELSLAIIGDKTLTEDQLKLSDIDENGKADLTDLARLKQYVSKTVTILKYGYDQDELLIGYNDDNQSCKPMPSERIALKCRSFCSLEETLKVDAAIGDTAVFYNSDGVVQHYKYIISADEKLIINQKNGRFEKEYAEEEWSKFDIKYNRSDYDAWYHETAEISFENCNAGDTGRIGFAFTWTTEDASGSGGDGHTLYYYVGKNGISLGINDEDAKRRYFNRFKDEEVPDEFTLTVNDESCCLAEPVKPSYVPGETVSIILKPIITEKCYKVNFDNTEEIISFGTEYSFVMPYNDAEITIEIVDSF